MRGWGIKCVGVGHKSLTSFRVTPALRGTATGRDWRWSSSSFDFLAKPKFLICSSVLPNRSDGFSPAPFVFCSSRFEWNCASWEGDGWSPFLSPWHYYGFCFCLVSFSYSTPTDLPMERAESLFEMLQYWKRDGDKGCPYDLKLKTDQMSRYGINVQTRFCRHRLLD